MLTTMFQRIEIFSTCLLRYTLNTLKMEYKVYNWSTEPSTDLLHLSVAHYNRITTHINVFMPNIDLSFYEKYST